MGRIAVAVVGGVLTLAGIALLVLPGPGFVLVAAGLALLATKFTWAARPLAYAKDKAQVGLDEVAQSKARAALAVVAALSLLVAGVLEIAGVDLPLVNVLTAALLVLSGLGLLGTVVYARRQGARAAARTAARASAGPITPTSAGSTAVTGAAGAGATARTGAGTTAGAAATPSTPAADRIL